jgi:hypothetical protein
MRTTLLAVVCGMMLAVAAPALASGPTEGAYAGPGANQISSVQNTSAEATSDSGTLPFTGLNLGLVAVVAVALVGAGFGLRRQTRREHS